MRFVLFTAILLLFFEQPASGQGKTRAEKFLFKANAYKAKKDTARAYHFAEMAIKENPSFEQAYSTYGVWLFDSKKFLRSARVFAAAANKCRDGKARFALPASRSYVKTQKPDSALYWLSQTNIRNEETQKIAAAAMLARDLYIARDTNQVFKLDERINTRFPEFFPSLSADGKTLYLTRRINGVNEDFFLAHPDSCGGWLTARNMGYPPNTAFQESAHTISADDHYLFFMRSDNRSENGWGRGGCDLYLAYRVAPDSAWSVPESFGATINTPAFEGMPSLSPDISDLYFVSDRPGGYGGLDIWVSHFSFGLWQLPVNLGSRINTNGNETAPFISSDNKTLYFSSDGHPGIGGTDLYRSKKITDSVWEAPVNLGIPINSGADDNSIFVCADGQRAFFASDRGNADGDLDIYETTLPQKVAPQRTAFAMCSIYDSLTHTPALLGNITLYDTQGNELAQYHANKGDGSVLMSLPVDQTFYYEVKGFNYTKSEGSINFPGACEKWCTLHFPLLPRDYIKPTRDSLLLTVFFAKNIVALQDSQLVLIRSALQNWIGQKEVTVFINGYTDNTGTPLINTEKSTIRANAIAEQVTALGFEPGSILATGFGDSNPLTPNDSPENQDMNRRVEMVIRW
jgi:hypothetical protein